LRSKIHTKNDMKTSLKSLTATAIAILCENFIADFAAACLTFAGRIVIRFGRLMIAITGGRGEVGVRATDGPWTSLLCLALATAFIYSCFQWALAAYSLGIAQTPWYAGPLMGFLGSGCTQIVQGLALRQSGIVSKLNRFKRLSQHKRVAENDRSLIDIAQAAGGEYNRAGMGQKRVLGFVAVASWVAEFSMQCRALTWVFSWDPFTWLALLGNIAAAAFCTLLFEAIVSVIEKSEETAIAEAEAAGPASAQTYTVNPPAASVQQRGPICDAPGSFAVNGQHSRNAMRPDKAAVKKHAGSPSPVLARAQAAMAAQFQQQRTH
jgi:hypothetical protein